MEFTTDEGSRIVVADVDEGSGSRLVSRGDEPALAARTFEASLDGARAAAESALRVFRGGALRPDSVEIEFGVRMSAEAGAVIVKGQAEGHLVVRLTWSPEEPPAPEQHGSASRTAHHRPTATGDPTLTAPPAPSAPPAPAGSAAPPGGPATPAAPAPPAAQTTPAPSAPSAPPARPAHPTPPAPEPTPAS
ncbi:CU044_2847 family protein [Streptomyces sp. NPDC005562]|uniref:CU044_2847 family protein n=1 Tax=Streptomyces sp. NPDC005562 TaxID=3154890 RepID=UPI0033B2C8A1